MALKPSGDIDELCYPYIYQSGSLCDFEVLTDELCTRIGVILSLLEEHQKEVIQDLVQLQPLIWHLNGSIRGRLALGDAEIQWLKGRYQAYRARVIHRLDGFVLPRGGQCAMQCHLARSTAKKTIRLMVQLDQESVPVDAALHRFCNLLCNFLFVLAVYVNELTGIEEVPFISQSYGTSSSSAE